MSESTITKRALAVSLKHVMEKTPLARVTVKDIVEDCGVNRQTFYYHFKDKFDLVNWIYRSEALESISSLKDYAHWTGGILRIFTYLYENRSFYVKALNAPDQNAFDGFLFDATHNLILDVVNELAGDLDVPAVDKSFITDFYDYAFVGIAVRWIKTGMEETPAELAGRISDIAEGSIRRALEKYALGKSAREHRSLLKQH